MLTAATLCSTIGCLVAADPSVEVVTQDSVVTEDSPVISAGDGGISLFPQRPFRFSATITSGYDDNVSTTTGGAGSPTTSVNLTVSKDLSTARTQLSIVMRAGTVYYFDQAESRGTDVTGGLRASLKHSVSNRLTLDASIDLAYLAEPEFASDLEPARRGQYFSTSDTLTASYKWSPRLSIDSSYQLRGLINESLSFGDRVEHIFGESFRFNWSPRATIVADYRFGLVDYYDSSPRDSSTHTALAGLDYTINPRLQATVRGGATFRTYQDEQNGGRTDPNVSASLSYAIDPFTNASWTVSYSIEEPNSVLALSRTTFRTGLQLGYQFTRRVSGQLGFNYNHNENAGLSIPELPGIGLPGYTDDAFALVLGARYSMTQRVSVNLGFTHTEVNSERINGGAYSRNRYTAGLTLSY